MRQCRLTTVQSTGSHGSSLGRHRRSGGPDPAVGVSRIAVDGTQIESRPRAAEALGVERPASVINRCRAAQRFVHFIHMKLLQALIALAIPALLVAGEYKTRNLVLVTADGLRWQEVFRGIDPLLMSREDAGMNDAEDLRTALWGDSPEQRRQRLLPFLWNELAPKGVIFGNAERGAAVTLRNRHRFSYPGYSEILTGRPQDGVIDSNDLRPNPSRTVLEILRDEWKLPKRKVALFGSWGVFRGIGANDPESVFINAGYQRLQMEATHRATHAVE